MSYQVLARKWRPQSFAAVIGQEHVVRVLTNALTQQRLHHAYLFTGTRGIGKTTIARILAKCLNCAAGPTATPCNKCNACLEIDTGRFLDLIEVDAASRTKVEDTRELLDNVQYLPTQGRFKVYLIDEVHMLSGHSFNALLKTLEEPPEHIKFLLATTDPQKLPITVLSRCLQFNLKAVAPEVLQKQLEQILTAEQIEHEAAALYQLALAASGSVRDALSLLDQAISFGQGKVLTADVTQMLGTVDTNKIFTLLEALAANDAATLLATIAQLAELALDFTSIINKLLEILHQLALTQLVPTAEPLHAQEQTIIKQLAQKFTKEEVQLYYQIGLLGKRDLPLAPTPRFGFEMALLRMLAFRPEPTDTDPTPPKEPTDSTPSKEPIEPRTATANSEKSAEPPATTPATNSELLLQLDVSGTTKILLHHAVIKNISKDSVALLLAPNQFSLLNQKHKQRITQAFTTYLQRPINITIEPGTANMDTPTNLAKRKNAHNQKRALHSMTQDNNIKELMAKFDAKLISDPTMTEKDQQ